MTHDGSTPLALTRLRRLALIAFLLPLPGLVSCDWMGAETARLSSEPSTPLRPVRVLVASDVERLRVKGNCTILAASDPDRSRIPLHASRWHVIRVDKPDVIHIQGQARLGNHVTLVAEQTEHIRLSVARDDGWSEDVDYPGHLLIRVNGEGRLGVVNYVDVEQYVPCVVAREVWPSFETEAYRAQAIAVRTYVLVQMLLRQQAPYDVRATEGSQVYKGIRSDLVGRRAVKAARHTRGVVCMWKDGGAEKLFSTYYSAACGGVSQSAAIFGKADDVPPLAGGVYCDYCRIAPGKTYRWGPVQRSCREVLASLGSRYPELVSLGDIASIEVIERTPFDRPVRLRITGSTGQTYDILAERFRLAIGSRVVRSTHFDIRVADGDVIIENGRGFGHGLGLCQWGMQGQALAGKRAGEILRYYYPGAILTRAY